MNIFKSKKKCCICYDPELDTLIYESKERLSKLSEDKVKVLYYGYSCDPQSDEKIIRLRSYLNIIEDENFKIVLGGEPCLDCINRQRLIEKIRRLTTSCDIDCRKDLRIDKSNLDSWLVNNPTCVAYEKWEELSFKICGLLNLEIKVVRDDCELEVAIFSSEEICNLTFEITRNIIPCDIIVAISIFKHSCDLGLSISRTENECEIDFNLLKNEVDCDLDLKTYKKLIDCNLTFDIIKTVYDNQCSFTIGDPVELTTLINSYSLDKFNFSSIPDIQALKTLGVNITNSEYIKNPQKFINKLKSDYR